jgi:heme-degrading monooxygenase HmoA
MYAVVNHFPLKTPVDQALIDKLQQDLIPRGQALPGFKEFHFIRVADDHAIVVVLFETLEALEEITRQVAAPWFAEHVGPYVAGPPERRVGEVVASSAYE